MEHSPNTIKEGVLKAISDQKVAMRSSAFFKAEFALIVLVSIVALVLTIGLAGFIFFCLRVNGHDSLLAFGPRGIGAFLHVFPWPLFILDLFFLFILQVLVRRFTFGYRHSIFVVLLILFVGGGVSALLLDRETSLHDRLMEESRHGRLPAPFSDVYGNVRGPVPHEQGIYRGVITDVQPDHIVIQHDDLDVDQDEKGFVVILPANQTTASFSVGQNVYVYGRESHGTITAEGIEVLPGMK